MSIAGIAKEVTTITISAWFFGDELTPLNITGVAITACGASRRQSARKYSEIHGPQVSPYTRTTSTENPWTQPFPWTRTVILSSMAIRPIPTRAFHCKALLTRQVD